jgi:haloacetate dehalogenase
MKPEWNMFLHDRISVNDNVIDLIHAGDGYPVVLLHGFPETKMAWHKIAPRLAEKFKVIIPDLPGYGDSIGPRPSEKHENHSKHALGDILIHAIKQLGIERFAVAGHDRGGRVAYRMALDHPHAISSLALLGIIPTVEMTEKLFYAAAVQMENWFFLSQPRPFPETIVNAMPEFYLNHILDSWAEDSSMITEEARSAYLKCFKNPRVIDAICEEYRATEIDSENDRLDHVNGKRITCPALILWSEKGLAASFGDPLAIWKNWANDVTGTALPCGHFLMEEAPDIVLGELVSFWELVILKHTLKLNPVNLKYRLHS